MIEKIRVSLWDIFTFFLSGLIIGVWGAAYFVLTNKITLHTFVQMLSSVSTAVFLFFAPLVLTAIGMLYEPIANYFDKLTNFVWSKLFTKIRKSSKEKVKQEDLLRELIENEYLGEIGQRKLDTYHLCKEYVETKQLSTTFMVYLSRYGFYRNAFFISFVSAVLSLCHIGINFIGIVTTVLFLVLAIAMKCRAQDFFSYMAPTIYRCFLIDKALTNKKSTP